MAISWIRILDWQPCLGLQEKGTGPVAKILKAPPSAVRFSKQQNYEMLGFLCSSHPSPPLEPAFW